MEKITFRRITVKGDAYNRGLEHGKQAKDIIKSNVDFYRCLWKEWSGLDLNWVKDQTKNFIPIIEKYDKDILEEMKGVSDGSGISLEWITALNARYEYVWSKMTVETQQGCTSLGAMSDVTATGHTYVGQNWDYKPKVRQNTVLLEVIQEPEKPNILMHGEAGIIGHKGMNSAGIGLVANALVSDKDKFESAVPFWVMVREVLNKRNLGDAVGAVLTAKRSVSGNLMIGCGQMDGEIINLEATPFDVGFMYPIDGVLAHANNFVDLRYAQNIIDKFKASIPDTLIRTNRAQRIMMKNRGKIKQDTFKLIFSDHFGKPNSICRHPDTRAHVDMQIETICSIIMDLTDRIVWITSGNPCENPYEEFKLENLRFKS